MSPSEPWEEAWLNSAPMPPRGFPDALLSPLLDLAEHWLLSGHGPRRQLLEFVSTSTSFEIMNGLLYSGFCHNPSSNRRIPPIPVLIQLLYRTPAPADAEEMERAMIEIFARVLSEWCRLHLSGKPYQVAP